MNETKKQIQNINILINDEEFLRRLCAFFNNNSEGVDKAIALIIVYYLNTLDKNFDYTIEELMKKVNQKFESKYLFASIDSVTARHIRIFGINDNVTQGELPQNLIRTVDSITYDKAHRNEDLLFTQNPHKAITDLKPRALYHDLLKEPKGEEKEISVTEPEKKHYTTILNKHILRVTKEQTGAIYTEGRKIINKYVDSKRHIVVVSSDHKSIDLGRAVGYFEAVANIYPPSIGFIELPSAYQIKQICLENNPLVYEPRKQEPREKKGSSLVTYYRFEPVAITDQFEYFNRELTGDDDYDVDILYAGFLSKDKGKRSRIFEENLERIKKSTELIQLNKHGNKYEIVNGRHRLVYLKHMFKILTGPGSINHYTAEDFKIPVLVNYGMENENCIDLLLTIKNRHAGAKFLKDNVNDDDVNLIIIIDDKVYRVGNLEELKEFVYSNHPDKYFIGTNSPVELDYEYIINRIIFNSNGNYKELSLFDIINVIKGSGIGYHGTLVKTNTLNYLALHSQYMSILANLERCKAFYDKREIMQSLENKLLKFEASQDILSFVNKYPEDVELNPFHLVELLKEDGSCSKYDKVILRESIKDYKINEIIYERNKRVRSKAKH